MPVALALIATIGSGLLDKGLAAEKVVAGDWNVVDAKGIFSFSLPSDMEPHPVQGQDTYVGEYRSNAIHLSFTYGEYGIDLCDVKVSETKPQFDQVSIDIDGRRARVLTFNDPSEAGFPYAAAACFDDLGADWAGEKTKLDLWAYCKNPAGQETAKKIFRSISIKRRSPMPIK